MHRPGPKSILDQPKLPQKNQPNLVKFLCELQKLISGLKAEQHQQEVRGPGPESVLDPPRLPPKNQPNLNKLSIKKAKSQLSGCSCTFCVTTAAAHQAERRVYMRWEPAATQTIQFSRSLANRKIALEKLLAQQGIKGALAQRTQNSKNFAKRVAVALAGCMTSCAGTT